MYICIIRINNIIKLKTKNNVLQKIKKSRFKSKKYLQNETWRSSPLKQLNNEKQRPNTSKQFENGNK